MKNYANLVGNKFNQNLKEKNLKEILKIFIYLTSSSTNPNNTVDAICVVLITSPI
jgi:hypothetical protein